MTTFHPIGPDYCTVHHGIREEDEPVCDFRDDDNPDHTCDTCEGLGYVEQVDPEDPKEACPDCDEGLTRCHLVPLGYMRPPMCRDCEVQLWPHNARQSRGRYVGACRRCETAESVERRRKGLR